MSVSERHRVARATRNAANLKFVPNDARIYAE